VRTVRSFPSQWRPSLITRSPSLTLLFVLELSGYMLALGQVTSFSTMTIIDVYFTRALVLVLAH